MTRNITNKSKFCAFWWLCVLVACYDVVIFCFVHLSLKSSHCLNVGLACAWIIDCFDGLFHGTCVVPAEIGEH
jgi:hypothetical protein